MASCLFQFFFHLYLFNVRLQNRGALVICQKIQYRHQIFMCLSFFLFLFYFWWKSVKILDLHLEANYPFKKLSAPWSYQIWGCHLQAIPVCGCDLRGYRICGCHLQAVPVCGCDPRSYQICGRHLQAVPYLPSFTSGSFRHPRISCLVSITEYSYHLSVISKTRFPTSKLDELLRK